MIRLEGLSRDFHVGDQVVHALDSIDLTVEAGEYLSIMGPSGSGKSTLLNVLGLLDTPTSGEYVLNGTPTASMNDDQLAEMRQNLIGFVFQFFHLVPRLSALENVELPMTLASFPRSERRPRAQAALESVDLADRMEHRPDQLSGGQRQRVALARSIIMEPKVLLADEPTGNLDSKSGVEVIEIVEALNDDGLTVILVTHDPDIGSRARRRLVLVDGRVSKDVRD